MENEIAAPRDGVVTELVVASGQGITNGQLICVVAATPMTAAGTRTSRALVRRLVDDAHTHRRQPEPAPAERPVAALARDGGAGDDRRRAPLPLHGPSGDPLDRREPHPGGGGGAARRSCSRRSSGRGCSSRRDADWQVLAGGKEARILRRPPSRPTRDARPRPRQAPHPARGRAGAVSRRARRDDARRQGARAAVRQVPAGEPVSRARRGRAPVAPVRAAPGRRLRLRQVVPHLRAPPPAHRRSRAGGRDRRASTSRPTSSTDCEALARRLGADGLRFEVGDIAGYEALAGVDLVVSLHACDTATDDALDRAVRAGAPVILAVPCCQHELLPSSRALRSARCSVTARCGSASPRR